MLGLYAALCYCSTRLSARPTRSDIMACWKTKMEITHKWVIIDAASQPASQPACLPASQPARLPASCASWQQPGRSANPRGSYLLASGVPSTNADDVHGTRETRMYQTCCHLAIRHEHAPLARLTINKLWEHAYKDPDGKGVVNFEPTSMRLPDIYIYIYIYTRSQACQIRSGQTRSDQVRSGQGWSLCYVWDDFGINLG